MPKITGSNIAEHVAEQEAAIFAAATRLFAEHGVNDVSMGAIANAVDLARPSLYRYFPSKAAIVCRWFDQAITPLIADSNRIAESDSALSDRFDRWIEAQIDFLADVGNQAMISASLESSELADEDRHVIGARHRDLYASLDSILSGQAEKCDEEVQRARVLLIVGLLRNFADLGEAGVAESSARSELLRAARLIGEVDSARGSVVGKGCSR